MSLIVSVKVQEGIVMAADSRVSMQIRKEDDLHGLSGIRHYSDNFTKIFAAPNGVGISFCGEMAIEKGNLNVYVERFLKEQITADTPAADVAPMLLEYMLTLPKTPATIFHVCGYEKDVPCFWRVFPKKNVVEKLADKPLIWDGEGDVLARILSPVNMRVAQGNGLALPDFPVALNLFSLQDAVDFADYAIHTTMDAMRFQIRPKSVGGPVDILVIKPDETLWIRKKTLGEPK
ncbi:MAG: hypothetical protein IKV45_01085 [Firmicutes bacterium]|nr:hypothetical protein [Bacillota bacterium]